jgi:putative component of toxin-antitoxin plasmid stabilization module
VRSVRSEWAELSQQGLAEIETLEGNTIHSIWSEDRQDWIPLGELLPGERLRCLSGAVQTSPFERQTSVVLSLTILSQSVPVYSIEVQGEHVYQVGGLGVLVHDECISRIKESSLLVREAPSTGGRFQNSINRTFKQLWEGNLTPGIGTKSIGNGISEARAREGARIYFRVVNGLVEILGKSDNSNQANVIAEIIRVFG